MKQEGRNRIKQVCADTDKYEKKIIGQEFLLGKFFKTKSIQRKSTKYTKSKIERLLNIQEKMITQEISFELYKPLHELWKSYAAELLSTADDPELKLLRADYHGASIKIIHSPITTYIGLEGIIINESLKTFKLIKRNNQIITLLKNAIVFELQIGGKSYAVNGNCLVFRAVDRTKHKFKSKNAEKINFAFLAQFLNN